MTDDHVISLVLAVVGIVGTIAGVFAGWWLSLIAAANMRKRRCLDLFFDAVAAEISNASSLPDNIDRRMGEFHIDSVRRLESMARYVERHHEKEWKKICPKWSAYSKLIDVTAEGGIASSIRHGFVDRKIILSMLNDLLASINE